MSAAAIIAGCITGMVSILLGVYISFTARNKGPIFSNTYVWFSKEEQKNTDRKAEYKMVTIVFGCLSVIFGLLTVNIFTSWIWTYVLMIVLVCFMAAYVVIDAVKRNRQSKEN